MPPRKKTPAEQRREAEAAENFSFYNEGVLEAEGHAVGEEPANDTSAADAAATQTALAIIPIRYSVDEDVLSRLRARAAKVTPAAFATKEGYEDARLLLQELRGWFGATERTRKALKAPVLERGDRIDETANGIKSQLAEIRDPIQALKDNEDQERARRRRAEEDAERERIRLEQEAALAAEREALEAQRRELAEAQAKARAEAERLAEEQRVVREAEAEERRRFEEERRQFAEAQARFAAAHKLDVPAPPPADTEVAENFTAALAESRVSQAEIDAALAQNPPSLSPGMVDWVSPPAIAGETESILNFARQIRALKAPAVTSDIGGALVEQAEGLLREAIEILESYEPEAASAAE